MLTNPPSQAPPGSVPPQDPTGDATVALVGARPVFGLNQETLPRLVTGLAALLPFLALIAVVLILAFKAYPAIKFNGVGFFGRTDWVPGSTYANPVKTGGVLHPVGAQYGAYQLIAGTLLSSAIALFFAVPISIGAALTIVEKLPRRASMAVGMFLETLAGIPSVVYGLWAYLTLGPVMQRDVEPPVASFFGHLPNVPILNFFRGPVASSQGQGLITAGLVLAIMIVPIIAATTRDLLRQVPRLPKEGALALGMNDWEMVRKVSLPWVRSGIIGASVLGLARALGETMAVAMIAGSALNALPYNLYQNIGTIAATIVNQLDGSLNDGTGFTTRTLAEFALVLAVITLATNVGARLIVRRGGAVLPVGRGV
ncbi:MAG TPA: phosphate ABC transporter permease subunit PstC [Acidimicrobiales bacterium]|nr:phosphate ABC transporter permease subunit PstC [Acidimicrobiales bacterium]